MIDHIPIVLPLNIEDERWEFVYSQFIGLVDKELRDDVQRALVNMHQNGEGLRCWINDIAYRERVLPTLIPREVLQVYLSDPEALPLHDCADCGLSVPVRPNRLYGSEADPEQEYFPICPACGGQTGLYCYWSNRNGRKESSAPKPR